MTLDMTLDLLMDAYSEMDSFAVVGMKIESKDGICWHIKPSHL